MSDINMIQGRMPMSAPAPAIHGSVLCEAAKITNTERANNFEMAGEDLEIFEARIQAVMFVAGATDTENELEGIRVHITTKQTPYNAKLASWSDRESNTFHSIIPDLHGYSHTPLPGAIAYQAVLHATDAVESAPHLSDEAGGRMQPKHRELQ